MFDFIKENAIALYGALAASASLIWHVYGIWRDKVRVVLGIQGNMRVAPPENAFPYKPDTDYYMLKVVNKGRRPVKLQQAGVKLFSSKRYIVFSDSFTVPINRVLTETSPATQFLCEQTQFDLEDVEFIWALDGAGRKYKKYLHKLPTMKKLLLKINNRLKSSPPP